MKKRILAVLLTVVLGMATVTTGCGSSTDSGEENSTTETEATDDTTDVSEEAISEDETTGGGEILTAETEITDEDIQEVYASIKESIETRYLEPNNILPSDFNWPEDIGDTWNSYRRLALSGISSLIVAEASKDAILRQLSYFDGDEYPSPSKEILDAALIGIIDWLESKGDYDSDYFRNLFNRFEESQSFVENLIDNVTFN